MTSDSNQLAKKIVEGEWVYSPDNKTLIRTFGTSAELAKLNLIDEDGYLDTNFKVALTEALGEEVLKDKVGPFGDGDIFSGDVMEEDIFYNIEFHDISEDDVEEFKKQHSVVVK